MRRLRPFTRARLILTLWYTAFCMALIVLLNFGAFSAQANSFGVGGNPQLQISPKDSAVLISPTSSVTTTISDINKRFGVVLFAVDLALIVLSVGFGYILSAITLRPLQKSMEEQEEFAQEASHELRTPLSVINLELETLKRTEKNISPTYRTAFSHIDEEVTRMSGLVGGLLTLVSPDDTQFLKPHRSFDLSVIVQKAFAQRQKLAKQKNMAYEFSSTFGGKIIGNEADIEQVVLILLDNAIKYSNKGGKVLVAVQKVKDKALIEVSDTGEGIAAKDLPHIFKRFYRSSMHPGVKTAEDGLGLGLAIAKKRVQQHGGKITVNSEAGKGTTFYVELPIRRA